MTLFKKISISDKELFFLSWPIFVELFLRVAIGNINVLMISNYSEPAVAAIGAANQLLNLSVFIYGFITVGAQIIIAQLIGAKRRKEIPRVISTALIGSLLLGLLISAVFILFPEQLLKFTNLDDELVAIGRSYIQLFGGSLVVSAISASIVAVLRSHGKTKPALLIPLVASLIAVSGNYVALYGPFGLPSFGVVGLAMSSVVGNSVGLIIAGFLLYKHLGFNVLKLKPSNVSFFELKKILTLGLPSSGESLSYMASQVVVTMIVAQLGPTVLIAKFYVAAITQFVYLIASSLAQGNQIMIGRNVGAREFNKAQQRGLRTVLIATLSSVAVCTLTLLFIEPIMSIFTTNQEVIAIAKIVFIVDIFLEAARSVNMVLVSALNATGDVKYPLICSLIVLWVISLPFSYLLAITLGMGLVGVWLAYAIDEILRSALMLYRWKSGVWRTKSSIEPAPIRQ